MSPAEVAKLLLLKPALAQQVANSTSPKCPSISRFDAVYCSFAFHHYPDPLGALREMRRVLRPGGHTFIVDAGPWWMKALASPLAKWGDPGWVAFHTGDEFERLFQEAGFSGFHWTEVLPGIGLCIGTA